MAALTMNTALGLTASEYGLAAGAFFWSYVLFQFPASLMLGRFGARVWISVIMAMWGAASAGTAFVTGETSFVAIRFLLGIAEAGFFPGVAYFMTCWFPAFYRGRMMGIFFAFGIFAGVLGGPLGAALLNLNGMLGIAGWQWLFLVEGLPAVMLAFYGFAILCNRPIEARWLAPEERRWLQQQLDQEATAKSGHGKGVLQSVATAEILALTLGYLLLVYGIYAMSFFLPLIVKSMGLSNTAIGYVLVLPSICGSIGMILFSRSSDRTGERIWHVVLPAALAGIAAMAAGLVLGNIYLTILAFCVAMFGISSSIPVFWNLPTAYFGTAAAAGGIALINSVGNVSGYLAPQLTGVLRDATGGYTVPMLVMGASMLTGAALIPLSGIGKHVRRGIPVAGATTLLH
jgi:MFS family permease